jgi:hypothetical protein
MASVNFFLNGAKNTIKEINKSIRIFIISFLQKICITVNKQKPAILILFRQSKFAAIHEQDLWNAMFYLKIMNTGLFRKRALAKDCS